MSDRTEFDELARRKLDERTFPFNPADWEDMQRHLPRHSRRRPHPAWFALLLLLPLGVVVHHSSSRTTPVTPNDATHGPASPASIPEVHSTPANDAQPALASAAHTAPPGTVEGKSMTRPTSSARSAPTAAPHPITTTQRSAAPRPVQHPNDQASVHLPEAITIHAPDGAPTAPAITAQPPEPAGAPIDQDEADGTTGESDGSPFLTIGSAPLAPTDAAIDGIAPPTPSNTPPTSDPSLNTSMGTDAPGDTTAAWNRTDRALAQTVPPVLPDSVPTSADSAASTLWPPLPPRPQWEITAWGEVLFSRTTYAGDRTAEWAAEHAGRPSSAYGVELMRTKGPFGLGAGLHLITYADHLEGRGLSDSHTQLTWLHQFQDVDTTILVTNGTTVINGQTYYVTYSLDTTIMVLVTTSEEETVTTVRRNALARTNRTSYLELPLLLDGHTDLGKWRLGIRGGPTLGVLQGRRGVLPGQVGYTDLNDKAFRELVFGWSAQAYIRYRLAPNWSVGLGPSARGQLGNTMQGDDLTRRSTAWGITLGVSYDLR